MKGKILVFLFSFLSIFFVFTSVYAEEVEIYTEEAKEEQVDEYTYSTITKILNEISKKLISIDSKLDQARITEDYARYPFIRLGIDSPYFGLASIIESRLNVKSAVSTLDMGKAYSIRSIVNTKVMLLEDIGVSDFVLSTRKVSLSNDMAKSDAMKCLNKLIEYLHQARLVSDYTEMQIDNIFSDYVSDNKEISKSYIRNEINNVNKILSEIEKQIMMANLTYNSGIEEDIKKYEEIALKVTEFKKVIDSSISDDSKLDSTAVELIQVKTLANELQKQLNEKYLDAINLNTMLQNTYILMNSSISFLSDIDLSESFEEESEENGIFIYLNRYISSLKKDMLDISDSITRGLYDNQDLDFDELKVKEESKKIYDIYLKFLNTYNVLLNEYIKVVVTTIKAEKFENLNLSDEIIYIFVDLDKDLSEVSSVFKKDSIYSNNISISKLKEIALKVHSAYELLGEK